MKSLTPWLKSLKHVVWLAPMLIVAGLVAGIVSGLWVPIPLGLVVAGIALLGLGLLFWSQADTAATPGFWGRRSTQVSANALVATLSMLAILGIINFLGAKYVGRLDLTENQVFTLAPQTQQLVRTAPDPLKVWVFDRQITPQDRELLESYRRQSPQFSYEGVDPEAQPTIAQQFEVKDFGDVYVEVQPGKRRQFVQRVNAQERLSEGKLTNAIEQVLSDRKVQVYFLQGHGERPLNQGRGAISQAVKSLGEKNYVVKPLNLAAVKEFPPDADVVVVAGAQKPLLEAEVTALETFQQRGGNLLLLVDPNTTVGIKPLLAPWGVLLDDRIVIDASGAGKLANLGPADPLVTQYGDHPITKEFGNSFSFYSLARPIDVDPKPNVKNTPLLYTSERTWAESDLKAQPLTFDPQTDRQGPFSIGIALSRPIKPTTAASPSPKPTPSPTPSPTLSPTPSPTASPTGSPTPSPTLSPTPSPDPGASPNAAPGSRSAPPNAEARLVVIGNSTFMTDGLFNQAINGDVFLNSVRWLSQQDQQALSIRPKEAKNRRITLTNEQANLVGWLALGIVPLLGFGTAFWLWWKRR